MHRRFIAAIAAASIVITAFGAAPARADEDDVARALAIILGLAVIGSALKDDNDARPVYRTYPRHPRPIYRDNPRHARPIYRGDPRPRPVPPRVNRKLLPQQCLVSIQSKRGDRARIFGQRCLEQNYRYVNRLPRDCATRIKTHRGWRYGYGARCLNRRGYALARR